MKKIKVGWFFGGRSVEHEVSVITALQAFENLDKEKYEVIPIYISKTGKFFSNPKFLEIKNYKDLDQLLLSSSELVPASKNGLVGLMTLGVLPQMKQIDLAFPLFHGSFGEDGCIQGVFEIYQIPYVGLNVTGSALAMDKVLQKSIYKELGLKVGKYFWFNRNEWLENPTKILKLIQCELKFPLFVKPGTIGSSIGISKAIDEDSLSFTIEVAATYSDKILIEEAFSGEIIEVNCSALGYGADIQASICEQPIKSEELLSFQDKYQRGGKGSKSSGMASLSRIIPAPISVKLTKQIQEATIKIFRSLDGCGVARIDYFVDSKDEKFWVNEINSPPGSLAFYLWEKSGVSYPKLLDMLIDSGLKRAEDRKKTQYIFNSGLLQQMAVGANRGSKK